MELIPTLIVATLGAIFALAGLVAGTGRAPSGAHAAPEPRRGSSWQAPRRASADS
jgi:hypothetical protein